MRKFWGGVTVAPNPNAWLVVAAIFVLGALFGWALRVVSGDLSTVVAPKYGAALAAVS